MEGVWSLTLRQLVQMYDACLINQWDQTITTAHLLEVLTVTVYNLTGKRRIRPRGFFDLHPYRKATRRGLIINPSNFQALRMIGNALVKR